MNECPIAHGYDPLDPSTVLDPHSALRQVRHDTRVAYLPEFDHYIVTRYDDIEGILLDREHWSASIASSPLVPVCPAAQAVLDTGYQRVPTLNNADPPRHPKMRKAVLACMTPRRLMSLEPVLREAAREMITAIADKDVVDFVDTVAFAFPGFAAFSLLGVPESDTEQLKEWSSTRVLLTYGRLSEDDQVMVAKDIVAMWQYVEQYVEFRVHNRGDDLTSDLRDQLAQSSSRSIIRVDVQFHRLVISSLPNARNPSPWLMQVLSEVGTPRQMTVELGVSRISSPVAIRPRSNPRKWQSG